MVSLKYLSKFWKTLEMTYVPFVTLSTQHNVKLLKQLESGLTGTINQNKYSSKATNQARNKYLDILLNPSFQGVNALFIL